jgi:hypothetical protein
MGNQISDIETSTIPNGKMQTNGVGANKYEITTNLHLLGSTPN